MKFDCTSMGLHTFDALCRPVSEIPPGGGTYFAADFAMAVSGAGSAAIVAAKYGLKVQAGGRRRQRPDGRLGAAPTGRFRRRYGGHGAL